MIRKMLIISTSLALTLGVGIGLMIPSPLHRTRVEVEVREMPMPEVQEDEAGWDCATMGNRICGPTVETFDDGTIVEAPDGDVLIAECKEQYEGVELDLCLQYAWGEG